jgi:hypothetical protein
MGGGAHLRANDFRVTVTEVDAAELRKLRQERGSSHRLHIDGGGASAAAAGHHGRLRQDAGQCYGIT